MSAQVEKSSFPSGIASESTDISPSSPDQSFDQEHDLTDADDALQAVGRFDSPVIIDEATNKRLLRKIDTMMMPILCIVYGLNYLDKTTLSYASITGLSTDIHLQGNDYSWLGSLFYIGYLGFEFIAVRLLQRFPLAKYSGAFIIAWGIVLTCQAAVANFAGAAAVRLLLGITEASVSPAWTLFTSQWYRKDEQALRVAWWFSFNGFAQIFGGLVAYGFANGVKTHGYSIAAWRAIYIFTGLLTIVFGVVFLFLVPDNQLNAKWLKEDDRVLAVERVRSNHQGIGNRHFKPYQLLDAMLDPAVWALFIMALLATIPNGGLTSFFSLLLESFDFSPEESLLYGCFGGVIEVFTLLTWGYFSCYFGHRLLAGAMGLVIALVGSIILVALPVSATHGRLAGFYLTTFFASGGISAISLLSSNIAGYTKKTAVAGGFFIFYSAGNVIGPQTFRHQDAPYYRPAEVVLIVCFGLTLLDLLFLHWWYGLQNRRKEAARASPSHNKLANEEFLDLTDRENPEFRYVQ